MSDGSGPAKAAGDSAKKKRRLIVSDSESDEDFPAPRAPVAAMDAKATGLAGGESTRGIVEVVALVDGGDGRSSGGGELEAGLEREEEELGRACLPVEDGESASAVVKVFAPVDGGRGREIDAGELATGLETEEEFGEKRGGVCEPAADGESAPEVGKVAASVGGGVGRAGGAGELATGLMMKDEIGEEERGGVSVPAVDMEAAGLVRGESVPGDVQVTSPVDGRSFSAGELGAGMKRKEFREEYGAAYVKRTKTGVLKERTDGGSSHPSSLLPGESGEGRKFGLVEYPLSEVDGKECSSGQVNQGREDLGGLLKVLPGSKREIAHHQEKSLVRRGVDVDSEKHDPDSREIIAGKNRASLVSGPVVPRSEPFSPEGRDGRNRADAEYPFSGERRVRDRTVLSQRLQTSHKYQQNPSSKINDREESFSREKSNSKDRHGANREHSSGDRRPAGTSGSSHKVSKEYRYEKKHSSFVHDRMDSSLERRSNRKDRLSGFSDAAVDGHGYSRKNTKAYVRFGPSYNFDEEEYKFPRRSYDTSFDKKDDFSGVPSYKLEQGYIVDTKAFVRFAPSYNIDEEEYKFPRRSYDTSVDKKDNFSGGKHDDRDHRTGSADVPSYRLEQGHMHQRVKSDMHVEKRDWFSGGRNDDKDHFGSSDLPSYKPDKDFVHQKKTCDKAVDKCDEFSGGRNDNKDHMISGIADKLHGVSGGRNESKDHTIISAGVPSYKLNKDRKLRKIAHEMVDDKQDHFSGGRNDDWDNMSGSPDVRSCKVDKDPKLQKRSNVGIDKQDHFSRGKNDNRGHVVHSADAPVGNILDRRDYFSAEVKSKDRSGCSYDKVEKDPGHPNKDSGRACDKREDFLGEKDNARKTHVSGFDGVVLDSRVKISDAFGAHDESSISNISVEDRRFEKKYSSAVHNKHDHLADGKSDGNSVVCASVDIKQEDCSLGGSWLGGILGSSHKELKQYQRKAKRPNLMLSDKNGVGQEPYEKKVSENVEHPLEKAGNEAALKLPEEVNKNVGVKKSDDSTGKQKHNDGAQKILHDTEQNVRSQKTKFNTEKQTQNVRMKKPVCGTKKQKQNVGVQKSGYGTKIQKKNAGVQKTGSVTEKQKLREQIKTILLEAGWKIDLRPRRNRDYLDSVYVSPQGTGYWSITKAYAVYTEYLKESNMSGNSNAKGEAEMKSTTSTVECGKSPVAAILLNNIDILKRNVVNKRKSKDISVKKGKNTGSPSLNKKKGMKHPSSEGDCLLVKKKKNRRGCTLLARNSAFDPDSACDNYVPYPGKRTVLAWMIDIGVLAVDGKVMYMTKKRTRTILEGRVTRDGIYCSCCSKIISVSKFEIHAVGKLQQPYENIFVEESGSSLLECQLSAWEKQEKSEKCEYYFVDSKGDDPNDDTCGICGDGGDLMCCDSCPSTFHLSCLDMETLPSGDWHCSICSCKFCGLVDDNVDDSTIFSELLPCKQCEEKYHLSCQAPKENISIKHCTVESGSIEVPKENASVKPSTTELLPCQTSKENTLAEQCTADSVLKGDTSVEPSTDASSFCGSSCKKIFKGLRKLLGVKNKLDCGFTWSLVQRVGVNSHASLRTVRRAECNSKVAVAVAIMDECFLPLIDHRSGVNLIHNIVYNSRSNFNRLNFSGPPIQAKMGYPRFLGIALFLLLAPPLVPSLPNGCFDPSFDFASTVANTLSEVSKVMSTIASFSSFLPDARVSSAVQDCLDLLDLSSDELNRSLAATQSSRYYRSAGSTRSRANDLRSWLSATIANQDTCSEGFDGTDGILGNVVAGSLSTITNFVSEMLSNMPPSFGCDEDGWNRKLLGGFPEWLGAAERRLLQAPTGSIQPDAVVAADGTGNFRTVTEAVKAAPDKSLRRFVIYVKAGLYIENVDIKKKKWNIFLFGDGINATVISGNRNFVDGWTTFRSATFAVTGLGFIARDITFENTAGPEKHQAVAFRSSSDLSALYHCEFRGYQDTLYAHSLRQFYRECTISGTVDFIFGNSASVFQDCLILNRLPGPNQKNTVTAQGRKDPNMNTAFTLQGCNITGDSNLLGASTRPMSYLGRPWKEFSRTVVMESYIDSVIQPEGWLSWNGDTPPDTIYYGEYKNFGPGAGVGGRVQWPGFHVISDPAVAQQFTVGNLIQGNDWLPSTGVVYTGGFME